MHARQASLSLLTIAPANRIAMHRHPGAEVLYIKKGRARILGPSGVTPEVAPEGTAVFIPAGMPHVIENMVRSAPVEMLQIFAPLGPERVYRDPTDAKGRAALRGDPRRVESPRACGGARFAVDSVDKATVYPQPGGKTKIHLIFEPATTGSDAVALSVGEFEAGSGDPPPQPRRIGRDPVHPFGGGGGDHRQREGELRSRSGHSPPGEPAPRRAVQGPRENFCRSDLRPGGSGAKIQGGREAGEGRGGVQEVSSNRQQMNRTEAKK